MSLDQNLFTLNVTPLAEDPTVVDLIDPNGNAHYRKQRVPGTVYKIEVYDPHSEGLLASVTAPSATSKHKTIELHHPSQIVELKYTGTLSFKWRFAWETHEFEWRREECFILRKPDPAVLVAVTKEPPGRLKTTAIQILDYNLNRFDIDDRKGLEIVMLTALLTFHDTNDAYHTPTPTPAGSVTPVPAAKTPPMPDPLATTHDLANALPSTAAAGPPPIIPPKPAPKMGIERIAEMHMMRTLQGEGEANEVEVGVEGTINDYAQYAEQLLKDDAMLFITLRSLSAQQVPKVLAVVEQTKRLRHKSGVAETDPLFQYVVYDTPKPKGPKRINLDDAPAKKAGYSPPTSLSVHLSKIDMPELQPRVDPSAATGTVKAKPAKAADPTPYMPAPMPPMPSSYPSYENVGSSSSGKDKKDKDKRTSTFGLLGLGKSDKKNDSKHKKDSSRPSVAAPAPNKLSKPPSSGPSLMPAPSHSPHPPSRPHSPYTAPPLTSPYASHAPSSPWNTAPPSGPDFPGSYAPPPQHPYMNPEPGGFFAGGFGGPSPPLAPPPPQHPSHGGYGGGGGGYNPGYI
ncbi:hypothetical protein EIP91_006958 [Steccherinum ochraceum]|uniref:Uncharacterized protein n=1 Tax=Steccherinum ochraceum TaxID=92696 RepID=A0A4R0R7C8_9APHY|nr:hypothetical protein EIP91_006958 [Steccherinum ochraceum]